MVPMNIVKEAMVDSIPAVAAVVAPIRVLEEMAVLGSWLSAIH
jgi:hypothetical protein